MSEMETFFGSFKKSDLNIEPEDTDDFYELEEEHGCHFVKVDGQLYSFTSLKNLDPYGFSFTITPSEDTLFIAHWYNGGAGIHEIVEGLIRRHVSKE